MKLNRDRVGTWYRADHTEGLEYIMAVDDLVTDVAELRAANDSEMRITLTEGDGPKSVTSLDFLEPVIAEIRDLWVNTQNRITGLEVLRRAENLRSLSFEVGSFETQVDLSGLPRLEEYYGVVKRSVASVLQNPNLRFLRVYGAIPKSFSRVAGAVERFDQYGGRSQSELPVFAQPGAMRSVTRVGAARFDLGQLSEMTGLEKLEISGCDDVVGLAGLSAFSELVDVTFKGSKTQERWEDLPLVRKGFLNDVSPFPSVEFLEERRAAGWIVPMASEGVPVAALTVDEAGDGESWGVYMSRFDDLAEAVDLLDGSVPGGLEGEALILGVVAELQGDGEVLVPEPDSEGSFTAVYFPNREQAELVFARTKTVLEGDSTTQLRYLRAASGRGITELGG